MPDATTESAVLTATDVHRVLTSKGILLDLSTVTRWMRNKKVPASKLPSGRYVMRREDVDSLVIDLLGRAS